MRRAAPTLAVLIGFLVFAATACAEAPVLKAEESGRKFSWTSVKGATEYQLEATAVGGTPTGEGVIKYSTKETFLAPTGLSETWEGELEWWVRESKPAKGSWSNSVLLRYPLYEVNSTPTGPEPPTGGWVVAYADGFGDQIGIGEHEDYTWYPNRAAYNNGNPESDTKPYAEQNTDVENGRNISVNVEGLHIKAEFLSTPVKVEGKEYHYRSGTLNSYPAEKAPKGYGGFAWTPGNSGETWCFEWVAKLPENTREADPAFWTVQEPPIFNKETFGREIDFPEAWGYSPLYKAGHHGWEGDAYGMPVVVGQGIAREVFHNEFGGFGSFDPTEGLHRYTTVIYPNQKLSSWVDGKQVAKEIGPMATEARADMLLIQDDLREPEGGSSGFTSGSREEITRSVAAYVDKAHEGVDYTGGGTAPGTKVK